MFEFDPFDPRYFDDPYPFYRTMRINHPVYKREIPDHRVWPHYWMLSRSADVDAALSDWSTYSSALGTLVDTDISLIPPNMFNMDPPRHDDLRGILSRALTPSRISGLEPHVSAAARGLIDRFRDQGRFDAATDFGHQIPTITMCALMDLPLADQEQFLRWNMDTIGGGDFTSEIALRAYSEMGAYWTNLVAERRKHPGTDLISQILHTEVEGPALSDEEVGGFCSLLHDASQNTTMNTIAHSVIALGLHPEQRQKVVDDPGLWPKAIEELLRWISPVQGLARTTTRDVTLHDTTIPAGDQVLLLYGSSNHDESVYPNPEELDFDRRDVHAHWAFGHGIHYCLGNAVARVEIRASLQMLLEAVGQWEVDLAGVERNQLVPTRGIAHAPISF